MGRPLTKKEKNEIKSKFIEVYKKSGALVSAAESLGISESTVYNWRKADKDFDDAIIAAQKKEVEFVESKLMELIRNGNPSAIYFYLKCKGGYRETSKLEVEKINDVDVQAAIKEIKEQLATDGK